MGHINKAKAFELTAGNVSVFGEFSEKLRNNKKIAALGTTPLALILSACGGGSSGTASSNVLTLTKSVDTYSASAVTGFTVADSSTAKFDVADATSNAYEIKLDASGTGVIEFDFVDANDTVTLAAGSKASGFTTLKVSDGTLDATNADLTGITRVEVASGIKISLAQIKEIPTIVANSATSEITVEVTTEAEATELVSLISAGTVKVFADTNPIKLVAAPAATVAIETLTTKQTETTASVKPAAEAPIDASVTEGTTDTGTSNGTDNTATDTGSTTGGTTSGGGGSSEEPAARFSVSSDASGNYSPSSDNGTVTLSKDGTNYVLTPASGTSQNVPIADASSFVVNNLTIQGDATIVSGETFTGGGTISVTGDATEDVNLTNISATGFNFGLDNTIAVSAAKTLTLDADQAATATSGITGAGNVTVEDDGAAANSSILITATGNVTVDAGTGNDTIDLGAAENVTADDTIDGGSGTDELQVTADNGSTGAVLDDLVDIDKVTIEAGSTATHNAKVTLQFTADDSNAMEINATALTSADADFTLVATDANVKGALTVKGGAGDDTISTGAGNDSITGGTGKDVMTGGAGNDEYVFTGSDDVGTDEEIVEAASGGTDKITVTGDTVFTTKLKASSLDEIDAIQIVGAKTATFSGAQLTGETLSLIGASGTTQALVVTATADATTDLSGISAGTNWTAGTDTITINGASTTAEIIVGTATNDVIDAKSGDDIITGGAGADAIDVDDGTDQVIINAVVGTSSDSGRVIVAASDDDDTGQDVIEAMSFGSGSDTIKIVATAVDSFVHGTDTDIGTATTGGTDGEATSFSILTGLIDLNQANNANYKDAGDVVVSVKSGTNNFDETNFEAALVYDLTSDTDGSTLTGGGKADSLTGGAGVDNITGGAGADTLSGMAGADKFIYASSADFIGSTANDDAVVDLVNGGDDTDSIEIDGSITIGAVGTDTLARVTNVEKLVAKANADSGNDNTHAITLTSDTTLSSIRTIDLSADLDVDSTTAITLTGVTVDTTIKTAVAGSSTIVGGSGVDTITGGAKADNVTGAGGADLIDVASDSAADIIKYLTDGDSTLAAMDKIANFTIANDKLDFAATANVSDVTSSSKVDVKAAITGGSGSETVEAHVTNGIVSLTGADAAEIDTAAEAAAVLAVSGVVVISDTGSSVDTGIIGIEAGTNTYIAFIDDGDTDGTFVIEQFVEVTGVTSLTAIGTSAAANTLVVM